MSDAVVKLEDILNVQNGFAFSSKYFEPNGRIGLIRIRDLKDGTRTEIKYSGEYSDDYVVRSGDLLIGMDGEFRCYEWKGEPALLNQRVCRLRDFHAKVEPRYLLYALNSHLEAIEAETGYVTVKHLSSKTVKAIEIVLPSVNEQQKIVAMLDDALRLTKELEESVQESLRLVADFDSSLFGSLHSGFDGEWRRLGDVCEIRNGATPKTGVREYWGGPHLWVTPAEMGGLSSPYLDCTQRTLTDEGLAACSATLAPPKSVILSCRAPIGHLVINNLPMATNQGCKTLIPSALVDYRYLYYFLRSRRSFLDSLGTGATFRELSAGKLKEVEMPLPSIEDQTRIAAVLASAADLRGELVSVNARRSEGARELQKSLFEAALSGDL